MLAIKRPFSNLKDFLIGIALYAAPSIIALLLSTYSGKGVSGTTLLFLVGILSIAAELLVGGYFFQCAKSAVKQDFFLPEWTEFGNLFAKGFLSLLISFLYALPVILILSLFVFIVLGIKFADLAAATPEQAFTLLGSGIIVIIACILFLFYMLPLAVVRFAATNQFSEAFALRKIFRTLFTERYAATAIAILLYNIAILFLVGILGYFTQFASTLIPLWNIVISIVTSITSFAVGVTTMTAFGELYGELGDAV